MSPPDAGNGSSEGARILVVEDDKDTRRLIRRWLEDRGYAIEECGSAEDALARSGRLSHDLALVDVQLPGIGGFELAPRLSPVPVLLMSVTDVEDVPGGTTAAGFLSKPFSRAGLERAVQQALVAR